MPSVHSPIAPPATTSSRTRWLLEPVDSAWRAPLAAACLVTAGAHVPVTGEHLEEATYIGVLFILLEVAAVLLAVGLVRRPARALPLAAAVVGALAVLALVVSRTVGLPLIGDDVGQWSEPLATISLVAEAGMVVLGLAVAAGRTVPTRRMMLGGVLAGVLLLGGGGLFIGAAASASTSEEGGGGHGDGSHDMHGMDMGLPMPGSTTRA